MNFYNSIDGIMQYLTNLGTFGRNGYLTMGWIDLLLVVTFFLLQATLLTRLLKGIDKREQFQWVIILPLFRSVADFFETISLMTAAINFPTPVIVALHIARIATPIKWIFMWMTIAVLLALIVLNLVKLLCKKLNKGIEATSV
jgi:hypothetical protein